MNPFRRNHSIATVPSARAYVWVYLGQRYNFSALNIPDLHAQVRANLSLKALQDGQLGT